MKKTMAKTAVVLAGMAMLGLSTRLPAQASKEGQPEVRIFVLDKNGAPMDVKGWTGAIEVTPENGTAKTYKLEPANSAWKSKEHSKADQDKNTEERYSNNSSGESRTAEELAQAAGKLAEHKQRMICGEAKKLDDGYCEMIVVWPKMQMAQPGEKSAEHGGFMHDHGGSYFKAPVDPMTLRDSKTNAINFTTNVAFTTPNGDTKYVKGFTYPAGMIDGAFKRLLDTDFKDTSKFDHEQAARLSQKVHATVSALPELSFKKDGDRQEYEKARQDCMAACKRLEQATGKDINDAADDCKSACKEVRSQAKDAQGAVMPQ
jgi:hypothetical protein